MNTTVRDICTLDYLVGTIATAYKGVITSLVAKDFCVREQAGTTVVKAVLLTLVPGKYEARLLEKGVILSRSKLQNGSFELSISDQQIERLGDLQIDIVQAGKHIGSFLLKRETRDAVYLSALELSDELKGLDLKQLTLLVREKPGLLQKAEDILAQGVSAKKDWPAFSEKLNTFALDVFWAARGAFHASFAILARFSRLAAEHSDPSVTNKPVSNFLDLLELPLEREENSGRLREDVFLWLDEFRSARMEITPSLGRLAALLRGVLDKVPDLKPGTVLEKIIGSLKEKVATAPLLSSRLMDVVEKVMGTDAYVLLSAYAAPGRQKLREHIGEAESALQDKDLHRALGLLSVVRTDSLNDEKMIASFFDGFDRSLRADNAIPAVEGTIEVFSLFPVLSPRARARMREAIPGLMEKLAMLGGAEACFSFFELVRKIDAPFREEILMNPRMASAIVRSGSNELARRYSALLTRVLIPSAKPRGLAEESWAVLVDPRHLERLTAFLEILGIDQGHFHDVLVHLVANLYLSGVYIPDDKLFQRRISAYLNSPAMQEDLLLNYLLLKKMPVYFNEVGATSSIRDYSTEIDSWGNDPTLYFLRKQVHVNASNRNIGLIEQIIKAWVEGEPALLEHAVPVEILAEMKTDLVRQYTAAIRPFFEKMTVLDRSGLHFDRLLTLPETAFPNAGGHEQESEANAKVRILCSLYRELVKKYSFTAAGFGGGNAYAELLGLVEKIQSLNAIIHSPVRTEPEEALFFKRHIAFGIPSVLGTYHEKKFDAWGEALRLESRLEVLLEEVVNTVADKMDSFTGEDVLQWTAALRAGYEALALRGFRNIQLDELVMILKHQSLRLSQLADLLGMWQKELRWIVEFVSRIFITPLTTITPLYETANLPDTLMNLETGDRDFVHKAVDMILRNVINDVPALVVSDRLTERLLQAITRKVEKGADELLVQRPQTRRPFFLLDELSDEDAMRLAPDLGGKAKNLVYLHNRNFRVPFGFVLSARHTHIHETYTDSGEFRTLLREAVSRLERKTGLFFGGSEKPLFLSIRSGSYISMPGILSSILYCGMNNRTVEVLIRESGDPGFAWDSYRRFVEHYGSIVLGVQHGFFQHITRALMKERGIAARDSLDEENLRELVGRYYDGFSQRGLLVSEDVYEQLRLSIRAVYASWFAPRAMQFRKAAHSSGEWGTAVAVMQMIPGNRSGSGASVFFTRDPFTYDPELYGETKENATGDDLVSGRQTNHPLARRQTRNGHASLEASDPGLFDLHRDLAVNIERAMGNLPQEVETTYVTDRTGACSLYVLQTRRMEFGASFTERFNEICRMEKHIIARGVGAHGGALSGIASLAASPEEAAHLRERTGLPLILLRQSADTEDISLMPLVRGIITATGGVTSHAAVLAQKFDVTAVVACSGLSIEADSKMNRRAKIGDVVIAEGDFISMDGATGLVFSGICLTDSRGFQEQAANKNQKIA